MSFHGKEHVGGKLSDCFSVLTLNCFSCRLTTVWFIRGLCSQFKNSFSFIKSIFFAALMLRKKTRLLEDL